MRMGAWEFGVVAPGLYALGGSPSLTIDLLIYRKAALRELVLLLLAEEGGCGGLVRKEPGALMVSKVVRLNRFLWDYDDFM